MILAINQLNLTAGALFYLFAAVTGASAIMVALSRNIVRLAVALLFTLAGVAGLYFLLNAEFLAAVQLVIYAGGTLILIVFGVMLTTRSPVSQFEPKPVEVAIAVAMGIILLTALLLAIPLGAARTSLAAEEVPKAVIDGSLPEPLRSKIAYDSAKGILVARAPLSEADRQWLLRRSDEDARAANRQNSARFAGAIEKLAKSSGRLFEHNPLETDGGYPVAGLGAAFMGDYLVPFELASILLLVVMIGAAYLAKARRRETPTPGKGAAFEELARERG